MAVESIGPAPAQFIYCAVTDKMRTQIASTARCPRKAD